MTIVVNMVFPLQKNARPSPAGGARAGLLKNDLIVTENNFYPYLAVGCLSWVEQPWPIVANVMHKNARNYDDVFLQVTLSSDRMTSRNPQG
ncbi:MAG: hypothetical protein JNM52_03320 [Betaproteobacteria bacterium]|nr:hypothetical protein [Betaproteobacteria bacterium]